MEYETFNISIFFQIAAKNTFLSKEVVEKPLLHYFYRQVSYNLLNLGKHA